MAFKHRDFEYRMACGIDLEDGISNIELKPINIIEESTAVIPMDNQPGEDIMEPTKIPTDNMAKNEQTSAEDTKPVIVGATIKPEALRLGLDPITLTQQVLNNFRINIELHTTPNDEFKDDVKKIKVTGNINISTTNNKASTNETPKEEESTEIKTDQPPKKPARIDYVRYMNLHMNEIATTLWNQLLEEYNNCNSWETAKNILIRRIRRCMKLMENHPNFKTIEQEWNSHIKRVEALTLNGSFIDVGVSNNSEDESATESVSNESKEHLIEESVTKTPIDTFTEESITNDSVEDVVEQSVPNEVNDDSDEPDNKKLKPNDFYEAYTNLMYTIRTMQKRIKSIKALCESSKPQKYEDFIPDEKVSDASEESISTSSDGIDDTKPNSMDTITNSEVGGLKRVVSTNSLMKEHEELNQVDSNVKYIKAGNLSRRCPIMSRIAREKRQVSILTKSPDKEDAFTSQQTESDVNEDTPNEQLKEMPKQSSPDDDYDSVVKSNTYIINETTLEEENNDACDIDISKLPNKDDVVEDASDEEDSATEYGSAEEDFQEYETESYTVDEIDEEDAEVRNSIMEKYNNSKYFYGSGDGSHRYNLSDFSNELWKSILDRSFLWIQPADFYWIPTSPDAIDSTIAIPNDPELNNLVLFRSKRMSSFAKYIPGFFEPKYIPSILKVMRNNYVYDIDKEFIDELINTWIARGLFELIINDEECRITLATLYRNTSDFIFNNISVGNYPNGQNSKMKYIIRDLVASIAAGRKMSAKVYSMKLDNVKKSPWRYYFNSDYYGTF